MRPPYTPGSFQPRGPVPNLRWKVPIAFHKNCRLAEGGELYSKPMTLQEAADHCAENDSCTGFSCREAANVSETVLVHFHGHSNAVKQPGWVVCRKVPELFAE